MGLANEPGKYSTANCMLVEYKFTMDELTDPSLVPEELHGEDISRDRHRDDAAQLERIASSHGTTGPATIAATRSGDRHVCHEGCAPRTRLSHSEVVFRTRAYVCWCLVRD